MFYAQAVLTKKGPLAKIWLAAHMQNKLTKAMVFATDVSDSVSKIIHPEAPMALRLTSNLLLGVARILSRKAKYLMQDSSEAMTKMKLTFRSAAQAALDLPDDEDNAAFNAITLADDEAHLLAGAGEALFDLDFMPRSQQKSIDRSGTSSYLAAERDITMDEFAGGLADGMIDSFALEPELMRAPDIDMLPDEPLAFTPSQRTPLKTHSPVVSSVLSKPGSASGVPGVGSSGRGSVEVMRDAPREDAPLAVTPLLEAADKQDDDALAPMELDEPVAQLDFRTPAATADTPGAPATGVTPAGAEPSPRARLSLDAAPPASPLAREARLSTGGDEFTFMDEEGASPTAPPAAPPAATPVAETSTPAAPTAARGRKRRMLLDTEGEKTEMTMEEFRHTLQDTSDLIRRPRARRRLANSPRSAPRRPEEMLARPVIAMPPELDELFAEWFAVDAAVVRGASPLSETAREAQADVEKPESAAVSSQSAAARSGSENTKELVPVPEDEIGISPSRLDAGINITPRVSVGDDHLSPLPQPAEEFLPPQMEPFEPEQPGIEMPPPAPKDAEEEEQAEEALEGAAGPTLRGVCVTPVEVSMGEFAGDAVDTGESETLSKRAVAMHGFIAANLKDGSVNLSEELRQENKMTRRTAARSFYEVLNLCSRKVITLEQEGPFGDVIAKPLQPEFDAVRA